MENKIKNRWDQPKHAPEGYYQINHKQALS